MPFHWGCMTKELTWKIIEIAIKLEPSLLHRFPSLNLIPIYPKKDGFSFPICLVLTIPLICDPCVPKLIRFFINQNLHKSFASFHYQQSPKPKVESFFFYLGILDMTISTYCWIGAPLVAYLKKWYY